jgi:nitroreductase
METITVIEAPKGKKAAPARKRKHPASGAEFNEVESVILQRRSVRNYTKTQVPEYLVKRVLECGRYAPSAGNNQSWKYVVVRDPQLLSEMTDYTLMWARRLAKIVDPSFPGAMTTPKVSKVTNVIMTRVAASLGHPTGVQGLSQLASGDLGLWHGAPTVILLLVDTRGTGKPYLDLGIAGQNMVLAAHSMGLGTCWVSFAMFLDRSKKYRELFGIEKSMRLATSLSLGFPLGQPDGYVARETHETPWFEPGGERRIVY